jgi:hypothetical protein
MVLFEEGLGFSPLGETRERSSPPLPFSSAGPIIPFIRANPRDLQSNILNNILNYEN